LLAQWLKIAYNLVSITSLALGLVVFLGDLRDAFLQGLTLPPLIRSRKLAVSGGDEASERRARQKKLSAALRRVQELREKEAPRFAARYDAFANFYQQRLDVLVADAEATEAGTDVVSANTGRERYRAVARQIRQAERSALMALHAENEISDGLLQVLERELDLMDQRVAEE